MTDSNEVWQQGLRQRIVRGAQGQVFWHGVRVVVQVATVSVLIAGWGLDRYGDWLILAALPTYVAASDIGFVGAATNEMIMAVGRRQRVEAQVIFQAVSSALIGFFALIALALPLIATLVPLSQLLNLATLSDSSAGWVFMILGLDALLMTYSGLLGGGFAAVGRYGEGVMAGAAILLVEFCGLATVVLAGGDPVLAAATMFLLRCVGTVVMYLTMRWRVPWLRLGRPQAIRPVIRRLVSPALASGAFPAALILNIQGMVLLIGVTVGPASAAIFSTLRTLSRAVVQLLSSVFAVISPEISRAFAEDDLPFLRMIHRRGCQVTFWVALPMVAGIALLAGPILNLWTSGEVGTEGVLLYIFLAVALIDSLWYTSLAVLYATNRHQRVAAYYFVASLVSLPVAYLMLEQWGLDGAALSILMLEAFMLFPILRQALPAVGDDVSDWLSAVFRPPIPSLRWVGLGQHQSEGS
jgi:O-antigen/teichoic acid export membrane protein